MLQLNIVFCLIFVLPLFLGYANEFETHETQTLTEIKK